MAPASVTAVLLPPPVAAPAAAAATSSGSAAGLVDYLNASPTAFHSVATSVRVLRAAGFTELSERDAWHLAPGDRRFFVRGGSTLVAFAVGALAAPGAGFVVVGAHTDSPCLKLKPISRSAPKSGFVSVGVEPYGGGLWYSWLDRDLGVAGRVLVRSPGGPLKAQLVSVARPVLRIPSLAIHLNREVNAEGLKLNAQQHLAPLLCQSDAPSPPAAAAAAPAKPAAGASAEAAAPATGDDAVAAAAATTAPAPAPAPGVVAPVSERHPPALLRLLASELGCAAGDIVDFDLQLTDVQPACLGGPDGEFVLSGRLDNLASCYASLTAFVGSVGPDGSGLAAEPGVRLVAHFDHEEVGSCSAHGAASPCLLDAIRRVAAALAAGQEGAVERSLRASFCVSADMAHAQHPNYPDRHEPAHAPRFGGGLVVKHNSNQRYATDGLTAHLFRQLGAAAGVPSQEFAVRSDLGCGSTIGPIISAATGIRTVDVGAPMLSMHSAREMASSDDVGHAVRHLTAVYAGFSALDAEARGAEGAA